jgi:hypothetical protein
MSLLEKLRASAWVTPWADSNTKDRESKAVYLEDVERLLSSVWLKKQEWYLRYPVFGVPAIFGYKTTKDDLEIEIKAYQEWIDEGRTIDNELFAGLQEDSQNRAEVYTKKEGD